MPTAQQVPGIVEGVEAELAEAARRNVHLRVTGHRLDDDWLYISVEPAAPGVRALDHSQLIARIERDLRGRGTDHVLLVPALEE